MYYIDRFFSWVKGWFVSEGVRDIPVPAAVVEMATPKTRRKRRALPETWVDGDYPNAKALLDDLQARYQWLKGFEPSIDQSGLRAIKAMGVYMVPLTDHALINTSNLDGGEDRPMPQYMTSAINDTRAAPDDDIISGCEMINYAEKHRWHACHFNVECPTGDYFYEFGSVILLDGEYHTVSACVEVLKSGEVRVLRSKKDKQVKIPLRGRHPLYITTRQWEKTLLPPSKAMEVSGDIGRDAREQHTIELFTILYNAYLRMGASTSIHATKGGTRMVFTVPMHSWKDFFKDRVEVLGPDGKKKRIFHHVTTHARAGGKVVKMHTRGLTRFRWHGFKIKICEWKPGRFDGTQWDLTPTVYFEHEVKSMEAAGQRFLDADETALRVVEHLTKDLHQPSLRA